MPATTSTKPSKHVCSDCGRAYKAAETLNRHRKNHSDTTSYACSICEASFKRKDLLDRHSQIHSGGKTASHRNRSSRACDRCSRLKTRCDNLTPCTRCSKGGHDCTYKQTRSRARTDRSSASTSSSMHSSPHMSVEELNSIAGTPEDISTFDSNPAWPVNDSMVDDSLWLQEPVWEWPQMTSSMPVVSPQSSSLRTTLPPTKDAIEPNFALDPALNLGRSPTTIPSNNLYDPPYNNLSWYSPRPHDPLDSLPVGPTCTTSNTSSPAQSDTRRTGRSQSTPTRTSTPALIGEAARIAQEATITELVLLTTRPLHPTNADAGRRKWFWQSMSSKIELAFNLDGLVTIRDSNIFEHFVDLFHKFFRVGWPARQHIDAYPPYLCLMMAAIGAAYAGPKAEAFHLAVIEALRPKLIEAALQRKLSPSTACSLIQSLALLQAAMIYFGDRKALEIAPILSNLIVSRGRSLGVFRDARHEPLAYGIARLDAAVASLFGTRTLLREEERQTEISGRTEDVLDRLLGNAGATAGMDARGGY